MLCDNDTVVIQTGIIFFFERSELLFFEIKLALSKYYQKIFMMKLFISVLI